MYKTAISRAFLSTPSNHGCVKSSAIYILLGRMTFAISVIDYLRWRACPALAPLASHQMLCFLYFGDRWPPVAAHGVKGDVFQSGGRYCPFIHIRCIRPPNTGCQKLYSLRKSCHIYFTPIDQSLIQYPSSFVTTTGWLHSLFTPPS